VESSAGYVVSFTDYDKRKEEVGDAYRSALALFGHVHGVDVPDGFDHVGFLAQFGAFYPGPSGKMIDDIMPEAGMDDVYYGSNRRALLPHTEGYEFSGLPPRYLALWCVTPPAGAGGETTLFDARPVVEHLADSEREALERCVFTWVSSAGLRRNGLGQEAVHPILEAVDGIGLLRFSLNNIVLPQGTRHERVKAFLNLTRRAFEDGHITVKYQRNDLLHWDNWRVLHSRNAFDDPQRHLRRIQIRHWSDDRVSAAT
jgi:alpha-ketoglutarate-dependent taurine dioxygenase